MTRIGSGFKLGPLLLSALFLCFTGDSACSAQDRYRSVELHTHFQNVAENYVMEVGSVPLDLRKQPLLRWDNPEREDLHGALYAWEKNGRPFVLGSIFTYAYDGKTWCRHEMLSLARGPVTARLDSEIVWSPNSSGLTWKSFGDALPPLKTKSQRLIQMRSLARTFSGKLSITDIQPSKLRLLPQPLIRYRAPNENVIDGAVFAFTVSTDAEILLLIEARRRSDDSAEYVFAAAPGHYHALELARQGITVWSAPKKIELESTNAGQRPWSNEPFFIFTPNRPLPPPSELR